MDQLDRITQNPEVMGGKACIRGMRVTVGMIVGTNRGRSHDSTMSRPIFHIPNATTVLKALRYAAWRAEEREVALARG